MFYHRKLVCHFTVFGSSDSSGSCRVITHPSAHHLLILSLLQTVLAVFMLILPYELGFKLS